MRQTHTLHARIIEDIRSKIIRGSWPPGTRLPFEVDLAAEYGCARMTVNKALAQLVRQGFLERRRRSGTFVRQPAVESAVLEITDIAAEIRNLGQTYSYDILARDIRDASATETADLHMSGPLLRVQTLHRADGTPFCYEDRLIQLSVVPQARDERFDQLPPGSWLLRQVPWSSARHQILAENATPRIAGLLATPPGGALLVLLRDTEWSGRAVTHVRLSYPGGRHHLMARFTP